MVLDKGVRWLLCSLYVGALSVISARAQTMDDGVMLSKKMLCVGALYGHDSWDQYWEGSHERMNGNIGTVTTQGINLQGNYAVTSRVNVLASAPYLWTHASAGVLHGQRGFQDLALAVKGNLLQIPVRQFGSLRVLGVLSGGLPVTNYTPDVEPLSLGTASKRIGGRAILNFQGRQGLYVNGSAAYTFRGNVKLDRSSYFTNDKLYFSNEVALPNVFDYMASVGYRKRDLQITGDFMQQQTRGGGDIRRQDMPFVSNRTNYSKAGATLKVPMPRLDSLQYWLSYANTFDGRNVGQANTLMTGLMYTFHLERRSTP